MVGKLLDITQKLLDIVDELKFFSKTNVKINKDKIADIESNLNEIKLCVEEVKYLNHKG